MDITAEIIEYELKYCAQLILFELCGDMMIEMLKSTVKEMADEYLRTRPIPPENNPLVTLINDICEEFLESTTKVVAKECINDTVNAYLEHRYVNHCYDAVEGALFAEELTQIAQDEIFNEFCLKLQIKFLNSWIDHDFIPAIARESHDEMLMNQEEELDQRDRHALEKTLKKYVSPQFLIMHLMMSMMSSFDTVMINHYTKGIMKRFVAHRLLLILDGLDSRVNHVIENEVERALFERLVLPTLQDEFIQHLLAASMKREDEIDFIESQLMPSLFLKHESRHPPTVFAAQSDGKKNRDNHENSGDEDDDDEEEEEDRR